LTFCRRISDRECWRGMLVGFDDPPALAKGAKTEAEALGHYRWVRDEIRAFVERLPEALLRG